MAGITSTDLMTGLEELSVNDTNKVNYRGSSELGKDEFLQLLVCQLQNQDPLNPQQDTEFIAQLAQFSSLEQMTNLNTSFSNSSAYSLVGKEVIVKQTDSNGDAKEIQGTVDYVEIKNGDAYLSIGGNTYSMEDLVQVMDSLYAIQEYLPSVEAQSFTFDISNPTMTKIKINLGSDGYEANSVAVAVNGEYISAENLTYEDGYLTISPVALKALKPGNYDLGLYFDDPYGTSYTDKVSIKVLESGISQDA